MKMVKVPIDVTEAKQTRQPDTTAAGSRPSMDINGQHRSSTRRIPGSGASSIVIG